MTTFRNNFKINEEKQRQSICLKAEGSFEMRSVRNICQNYAYVCEFIMPMLTYTTP